MTFKFSQPNESMDFKNNIQNPMSEWFWYLLPIYLLMFKEVYYKDTRQYETRH